MPLQAPEPEPEPEPEPPASPSKNSFSNGHAPVSRSASEPTDEAAAPSPRQSFNSPREPPSPTKTESPKKSEAASTPTESSGGFSKANYSTCVYVDDAAFQPIYIHHIGHEEGAHAQGERMSNTIISNSRDLIEDQAKHGGYQLKCGFRRRCVLVAR